MNTEGDNQVTEQTDEVLSHKEEQNAHPDKKNADKAKSREAYFLRQREKAWKKDLQDAEKVQITDEDIEAAKQVLKAKGYKLDTEEDSKQVDALLEATTTSINRATERSKQQGEQMRVKAATDNLNNTLQALGYKSGSIQLKRAGNLIFQEINPRFEDPDAYLDEDRVMSLLQDAAEKLLPKKEEDPVEKAISKKSVSSGPSSESRTSSKNAVDPDVEREAQSMRISKTVAQRLKEKSKNLPRFAR